MEKAKELVWRAEKTHTFNGQKFLTMMKASLDDDCHNGVCDFSITCDTYLVKKNGDKEFWKGGCCHEDVVKYWPEMKKFIPLHLCNRRGQPMYPVGNGMYHFNHSNFETACEYLRVTPEEGLVLAQAAKAEDDVLFVYRLISMRIVERWQMEADEFIKFLEEKTGKEWENPYNEADEKFVIGVTEKQIAETEALLAKGYYTEQAIEKRANAKIAKAAKERRRQEVKYYNEKIAKLQLEKKVHLYVLDHGLPVDNFIFYSHKNEAVFNWMEHSGNKITKEQFDKFLENPDLPEGVTFKMNGYDA